MIAVRFALYGVLGALFGLSAFVSYGLRSGERGGALALRPWLVALAVAGFALTGGLAGGGGGRDLVASGTSSR